MIDIDVRVRTMTIEHPSGCIPALRREGEEGGMNNASSSQVDQRSEGGSTQGLGESQKQQSQQRGEGS